MVTICLVNKKWMIYYSILSAILTIYIFSNPYSHIMTTIFTDNNQTSIDNLLNIKDRFTFFVVIASHFFRFNFFMKRITDMSIGKYILWSNLSTDKYDNDWSIKFFLFHILLLFLCNLLDGSIFGKWKETLFIRSKIFE